MDYPFFLRPVILLALLIPVALLVYACASAPSHEDVQQAETHITLGSSFLANGQLNKAYIEFQTALKLNPENKEALNYLGYISTQFNKYEEAISYYQRAVAIDPNYSEAINNLGVTYAEIENWDEAIKYFKAALNNPTYKTPERAYSNLGYAYYMKGNYLEAEKSLNEALMRNPISARAMYVLGLVHTKLDDDERAISDFRKAIGVITDYIDAHWELAQAYMRTGEKARALKHFEIVAEKDEDPLRIREASEMIQRLKYDF